MEHKKHYGSLMGLAILALAGTILMVAIAGSSQARLSRKTIARVVHGGPTTKAALMKAKATALPPNVEYSGKTIIVLRANATNEQIQAATTKLLNGCGEGTTIVYDPSSLPNHSPGSRLIISCD